MKRKLMRIEERSNSVALSCRTERRPKYSSRERKKMFVLQPHKLWLPAVSVTKPEYLFRLFEKKPQVLHLLHAPIALLFSSRLFLLLLLFQCSFISFIFFSFVVHLLSVSVASLVFSFGSCVFFFGVGFWYSFDADMG